MGIRKTAAEAISTASSALLRHVFRRPAGNFPGKIALYIDPAIIADTASKLRRGSVCVVGTNGKTTVTNMLADCLEAAGQQVVCNRTGANLDSGVATSMLQARAADWGVFECDELWLAKILPHLQSDYVLLLNLFYDQLDRVGDVAYIQESIIGALQASPRTVLVYNADDPHCERIARAVENPKVPFGMGESLGEGEGASEGVSTNAVKNASLCQQCSHMLNYAYHSYSQLGSYACPHCNFARADLAFMVRNYQAGAEGMGFDVVAAADENKVAGGTVAHLDAPYSGTYMAYNLLAVYAAGHLIGLSNHVIQLTMSAYDPRNGRLEQLDIHGHSVLLNLAKNPTGFNQNVALVLQEEGPVAVAFFVNDMEGDGRDVSWIWDVEFEALAKRPHTHVFAGGMRANDLQVRLKYADIDAPLVGSADEVMKHIAALDEVKRVYMIANYTSLPVVREECVALAAAEEAPKPISTASPSTSPSASPAPIPDASPSASPTPIPGATPTEPLRILHLFPNLLDQGGDTGNVTVLAKRCEWRGIPVDVQRVYYGMQPDFSQADIVVLGDGFDRQQRVACNLLMPHKNALAAYIDRGGVLLAVDGGLQILGTSWQVEDEELEGLGVLDICNGRTKDQERIVGDIALQTNLVDEVLIGFENHAGTTTLGSTLAPLGTVLKGTGNNTGDKTEGVHYKNVLGTYLHGPVLANNPRLADWLLMRALEGRNGVIPVLAPLDDQVEEAANAFMKGRLGV